MSEIEPALSLVVDASVAVKWCVEAEPRTEEAMSLLGAHMSGRATLALLDFTVYEVGNALANKGFGGEDLGGLLGSLLSYDFVWLTGTDQAHVAQAADMATRHGLSFYDASYLAAALLHDLPLVTDDAALFQAASTEGVGIDLASVGAV